MTFLTYIFSSVMSIQILCSLFNSFVCFLNVVYFFTFFKKILFIYLFMAVLGLRFCARAFSSCGKRGPLFIAVRGPLTIAASTCCGAQAPDAQAQQLWLTGLVALRHVGSSQTRTWTCVPCIGRQILNHCATREALFFFTFLIQVFFFISDVHLQIFSFSLFFFFFSFS